MLDGILHAVKVGKGRVAFDHLVGEDPRQARVHRGVDQFGFANGLEQAFGGSGIGQRIGFAQVKVLLQAVLLLPGGFETVLKMTEYAHDSTSLAGVRSGASTCSRLAKGDGIS